MRDSRAILHDIRYGLASFARTPAFTAAAVLSLAIGVGVNTSTAEGARAAERTRRAAIPGEKLPPQNTSLRTS
jgi:hypothetical protein